MSADELYHQDAEGCLFSTCSVLWLQLRDLCQLTWLLYCTSTDSKSFWLPIWQKSDPKIGSTTAANWGRPRSTTCGGESAPSQCFWAQWHTDWGPQQDCIGIPGIHLLLDEFCCSSEEGVASEAVTARAGFKLPSNNH